jgi:hypothetical protein
MEFSLAIELRFDLCQWYKGNAQLGSSTTHVRAAGTVLENAKTLLLISWQNPLPRTEGYCPFHFASIRHQ